MLFGYFYFYTFENIDIRKHFISIIQVQTEVLGECLFISHLSIGKTWGEVGTVLNWRTCVPFKESVTPQFCYSLRVKKWLGQIFGFVKGARNFYVKFLKYVCLTKIHLLYKNLKIVSHKFCIILWFMIFPFYLDGALFSYVNGWCKWNGLLETQNPLPIRKKKNFFESQVTCMLNFIC